MQQQNKTNEKHDMIKDKGIINIDGGHANTEELHDSIAHLPDGEYGYLIFNKEKNKALPQLKYLFGIVLKNIAEKLPDNPSPDALYKYFEEIYAPLRSCCINGERYEYFDLKNEPSKEMNNFIERVIHHAKTEWDISAIPTREELKSSGAKSPYIDAYASTWDNYSRKV